MTRTDFTTFNQFARYARRRFQLALLGGTCFTDSRLQPQIPGRALGLSLVLGEVVHVASRLRLQQETVLPQWQRSVGYRAAAGSNARPTPPCGIVAELWLKLTSAPRCASIRWGARLVCASWNHASNRLRRCSERTRTAGLAPLAGAEARACSIRDDRQGRSKSGQEVAKRPWPACVSMVGPEGFEPPTKRL